MANPPPSDRVLRERQVMPPPATVSAGSSGQSLNNRGVNPSRGQGRGAGRGGGRITGRGRGRGRGRGTGMSAAQAAQLAAIQAPSNYHPPAYEPPHETQPHTANPPSQQTPILPGTSSQFPPINSSWPQYLEMQSGHPESANATEQPIYHAGTSQQSFSFDGFPQQSTGVGSFNLASEDDEAAPRFPATAPEEDDYADTTMRAEDFLNNIHSWGDPPVLQIYNPTAQTNDLVSSSATNYGLPTSNQDMAQRNTAQPNHHFPGNTLTQHSNIAWSSTSSNSRGGPSSDYSLQGTHSSTAPSSSYASMSEAQRAEAEKMLRDRLSQSLYTMENRDDVLEVHQSRRGSTALPSPAELESFRQESPAASVVSGLTSRYSAATELSASRPKDVAQERHYRKARRNRQEMGSQPSNSTNHLAEEDLENITNAGDIYISGFGPIDAWPAGPSKKDRIKACLGQSNNCAVREGRQTTELDRIVLYKIGHLGSTYRGTFKNHVKENLPRFFRIEPTLEMVEAESMTPGDVARFTHDAVEQLLQGRVYLHDGYGLYYNHARYLEMLVTFHYGKDGIAHKFPHLYGSSDADQMFGLPGMALTAALMDHVFDEFHPGVYTSKDLKKADTRGRYEYHLSQLTNLDSHPRYKASLRSTRKEIVRMGMSLMNTSSAAIVVPHINDPIIDFAL